MPRENNFAFTHFKEISIMDNKKKVPSYHGVKFVNLCDHPINIITKTGMETIEPSGTIARCKAENVLVAYVNGLPVTEQRYTQTFGLPAPQPNTIYLVSSTVCREERNRKDLLCPGIKVKDLEGKDIACTSLTIGEDTMLKEA